MIVVLNNNRASGLNTGCVSMSSNQSSHSLLNSSESAAFNSRLSSAERLSQPSAIGSVGPKSWSASARLRQSCQPKTRRSSRNRCFSAARNTFDAAPLVLCGGIAKMRTRHFLAAVRRNHATLARKVLRPVYLFETRKLLRLGRVLKIRVSVVRFRPWPPLLSGSVPPSRPQLVPSP